MTYRQITSEQRYMLAALRMQGLTKSAIAKLLGCHRSTVGRELKRNCSVSDGRYRAEKAQERANGRRSRSRRNQQFTLGDFEQVDAMLAQRWSPEQIAGRLALEGSLAISHETIYRHVWRDEKAGGHLHTHLRGAQKLRRKGYGHYDSRGRLAGKRHISERPASVESRREFGHWEIDTVMGKGSKDCILSLVERRTGLVMIGKLPNRTTAAVNARALSLIQPRRELFAPFATRPEPTYKSEKVVQTTGATSLSPVSLQRQVINLGKVRVVLVSSFIDTKYPDWVPIAPQDLIDVSIQLQVTRWQFGIQMTPNVRAKLTAEVCVAWPRKENSTPALERPSNACRSGSA